MRTFCTKSYDLNIKNYIFISLALVCANEKNVLYFIRDACERVREF
jgi:hypothetical protein